jgi:hypothetical protein
VLTLGVLEGTPFNAFYFFEDLLSFFFFLTGKERIKFF